MRKILFLFAIAMIVSIGMVWAQDDYTIKLESGSFTPPQNIKEYANKRKTIPVKFKFQNKYYVVLQFSNLPDSQDKKALAADGIVLLDYIPGNAYIASINESTSSKKLLDANVRSLIGLDGMQKIDANLKKSKLPQHAVKEKGTIDLSVIYYKGINIIDVKAELAKLGAKNVRISQAFNKVRFRISDIKIKEIAEQPWIMWVSPIAKPKSKNNLPGSTMHRANVLQNSTGLGRDLTGAGVKVGIWDGDVESHIDFTGRVNSREFEDHESDHGTHVAGTVAGAGLIDPYTKGMAPEAELFCWNYITGSNELNIMEEFMLCAENDGIVVSNHSYGVSVRDNCDYIFRYDEESYATDIMAQKYPFTTNVFASGNDRTHCDNRLFYTTDNNNKNSIVVGNIDSNAEMDTESSSGPTYDGRLTPHICGVGTGVNSTSWSNGYETMSGTSMASPGVAGSIALLYQRFRQLNNDLDPRSDLIKSVVCNTADDIGNPGPDYTSGFGGINSLKAVQVLEQQQYFLNEIDHGESKTETISVPEEAIEVRVTIAWIDEPADPASELSLVNNLDLSLSNGSTTTLPWILDPENPAENAVRGVDVLNNIEQVTIKNPTAGDYTITVAGTSVPVGPQTYAVSYEIIKPYVTITYPIGGELLNPGSLEYIRWDAQGSDDNFILDYSVDGGKTFEIIASDIPADVRYYEWEVSGFSAHAIFRIMQNDHHDISKTPITIMGVPQNFTVGFDACGSIATCSWDAVESADKYEIMQIENNEIKVIATVTEPNYTLTGLTSGKQNWYSVRAIDDETGAVSQRAVAQQVNPITTIASFPFAEDFEQFETNYFTLESGDLSGIDISNFDNNYYLRFMGGGSMDFDWDNPWQNADNISSATVCGINATDVNSLTLSFDIMQINTSDYTDQSQFRVLVITDIGINVVSDILGRDIIMSDIPIETEPRKLYYNLSEYAGSEFVLRFEALGEYGPDEDGEDPLGDATYIDNITLTENLANDGAISNVYITESAPNLTATEAVEIEIINFGSDALSNFNISYQIDENEIITETVTASIESMEAYIYTFNQQADFSTPYTSYEFKASLSITDDGNTENNQFETLSIDNYGPVVLMPTDMDNALVICDAILVDDGATFYDYQNDVESSLTIYPEIPGNAVQITFTTFDVEPAEEDGEIWDNLIIYNGNTEDETQQIGQYHGVNSPGTIVSTAFDGSLTLRWHADTYSGAAGWEANISCIPVERTNDVGVISVVSPESGGLTSQEQIVVEVANYGSEPQSDVSVTYTVDGVNPVTEVITATIEPTSSFVYAFSVTADLSSFGNTYEIVASTSLIGDENIDNNNSIKEVSVSYCNAYSYPLMYISSVTIGEFINETELDEESEYSDYSDNPIDVYYNVSYPVIVENGDLGYMSASSAWIDWNNDGYFAEDEKIDLVGDDAAMFGTILAPETATQGLKTMRVRMDPFGIAEPCGNGGDPANWTHYGEIEDYTINLMENPILVDASIENIISPMSNLNLSNDEQLIVQIANPAGVELANLQVSYQINDQALVIETLPMALSPMSSIIYTFNQTLDLSAFGEYNISVSAIVADDENIDDNQQNIVVAHPEIPTTNAYVLDFDGDDDQVVCDNSESLNKISEAVAVEAWIYPRSYGEAAGNGFGRIIDKNNIICYLHDDANSDYGRHSIVVSIDGENGTKRASTGDNSIVLNTWQHVAFTYDAETGDIKIFINGVDQEVTINDDAPVGTPGAVLNHDANPLYIGEAASQARAFEGMMDEVQIWNIVRNPQQIIEDMISDNGNEAGLVGYWKFASGPDSKTAYDFSANNSNADLINMDTDASEICDWVVPAFISDFKFAEETSKAIIDNDEKSIIINVLPDSDLTNLVASVDIINESELKVGNTIQEIGVTANDFTNPVVYTASKEGVIQDWTVTIFTPGIGTAIKSFSFEATNNTNLDEDVIGTIEGNSINVSVPFGTDISELLATYELDQGAEIINTTIPRAFDMTTDFSVVYTIKAEDGLTIENWTIYVEVEPNTESNITAFSFAEQTGEAVIDTENRTIAIEVVKGTDITALTAIFAVSENAIAKIADIEQISASTANDFTYAIAYTVEAENATTQDWTVNVTEAKSNEAIITAFSLSGQTGDVVIDASNHTITVVILTTSDKTSLAATFTLSDGATAKIGNSEQINGTTANDFTNAVVYTVTAEDGTTTQDWTVNTNVTGINDFSIEKINIYPNPAINTLNITNVENAEIYIYNMIGKMVSHTKKASDNTFIDVSELSQGCYIVEISIENKTITHKIDIIK